MGWGYPENLEWAGDTWKRLELPLKGWSCLQWADDAREAPWNKLEFPGGGCSCRERTTYRMHGRPAGWNDIKLPGKQYRLRFRLKLQ